MGVPGKEIFRQKPPQTEVIEGVALVGSNIFPTAPFVSCVWCRFIMSFAWDQQQKKKKKKIEAESIAQKWS